MLVTHKKIVTIVLLLLRKKALKTLHSKISDVKLLAVLVFPVSAGAQPVYHLVIMTNYYHH